jgi:hypothetical protein
MFYNIQGNHYEINCEDDILKSLYKNIRNELYNSITKVVSLCSEFIEYNIDGVSIFSKDVDNAIKGFDCLGLDYKITRCVKISEENYKHGCKIKNFKIKKHGTSN